MTVDEAVVALATTTRLSAQEWADFLDLAPDQQIAAARAYQGASWVQSGDTFAEVLGILAAVATVAGAASGVAGAYSAIKSLAS